MKKTTCPFVQTCKLFSTSLNPNQRAKQIFKTLYCEADNTYYKKCARYLFTMKQGQQPPSKILPNDHHIMEYSLEPSFC